MQAEHSAQQIVEQLFLLPQKHIAYVETVWVTNEGCFEAVIKNKTKTFWTNFQKKRPRAKHLFSFFFFSHVSLQCYLPVYQEADLSLQKADLWAKLVLKKCLVFIQIMASTT